MLNRGHGIGRTQIHVIVAVNAERRLNPDPYFIKSRGHGLGQSAAVCVAKHHDIGARARGLFHGLQSVFRVGFESVEKMLRVVNDFELLLFEKSHRIMNHGQIFFQRSFEHIRHMHVPALAENRDGFCFGV